MKKPVLAVTMGDPAGVGPEILLKALRRPSLHRMASFIVLGDSTHLKRVARIVIPAKAGIQTGFPIKTFGNDEIIDFKNVPSNLPFGKVSSAAGRAATQYIESAFQLIQRGQAHAMVTAPINKAAIRSRWIGHTEFLARLTKTRKVALMLMSGSIRAIHVTSHVPLKNVSRMLTRKRIRETIELAHQGLRRLGIRTPRIAVCGLNPHAGDEGKIGWEEKRIIRPAVQDARRKRIHADGPFSADTVWLKVKKGDYHAGVAMYHDQGQIPVKLNGFGKGVNMTLGLPFIRTSVDHGTAFDIAGKGIASEESMVEAIKLAAKLARC